MSSNNLNNGIGKLANKLLNKKKKARRLVLYIVIFIIIVIIITIATSTSIQENLSIKTLLAAGDTLDIWGAEEGTNYVNAPTPAPNNTIKYGMYPTNNTMRIRQEMMEICNQVGSLYGISGKLVLAIAMVETSAYSIPILENGESGSLYTDLCLGNTNARDSNPMFVDGDNTGKYKDKNDVTVTDPLKVGTLRSDYDQSGVAAAVGPYQFYSSGIEGYSELMYTGTLESPAQQSGMTLMSYFDKELGFMRPNPMYFPDAALNATQNIASYMESHKGQLDDLTQLNLPESIQNEILFLYASDRYHGDMAVESKGPAYKILHDTMGELYGNIYTAYQAKGILQDSLGDFSKNGYAQANVRAFLAGSQYTSNGNIDFDGTYDKDSAVVKTDSIGKYVEVGGVKYYKPLAQELSNTPPFNLNYSQIIDDAPAGTSSGTNNKFGILYGFQGINAVDYYWTTWENQIIEYNNIASSTANTGTSSLNGSANASVKADAFPVIEDYRLWLSGDIEDPEENQTLLKRLAYVASVYNKKLYISSGYRSIADQIACGNYYLNLPNSIYYKKSNGGVYFIGSDGREHCMVAPPGQSMHQYGLAADSGSAWFTNLKNSEIRKFGLIKPLIAIDDGIHQAGEEEWHTSPIELYPNK